MERAVIEAVEVAKAEVIDFDCDCDCACDCACDPDTVLLPFEAARGRVCDG